MPCRLATQGPVLDNGHFHQISSVETARRRQCHLLVRFGPTKASGGFVEERYLSVGRRARLGVESLKQLGLKLAAVESAHDLLLQPVGHGGVLRLHHSLGQLTQLLRAERTVLPGLTGEFEDPALFVSRQPFNLFDNLNRCQANVNRGASKKQFPIRISHHWRVCRRAQSAIPSSGFAERSIVSAVSVRPLM